MSSLTCYKLRVAQYSSPSKTLHVQATGPTQAREWVAICHPELTLLNIKRSNAWAGEIASIEIAKVRGVHHTAVRRATRGHYELYCYATCSCGWVSTRGSWRHAAFEAAAHGRTKPTRKRASKEFTGIAEPMWVA
jgi:hypothetical protein